MRRLIRPGADEVVDCARVQHQRYELAPAEKTIEWGKKMSTLAEPRCKRSRRRWPK